MNKQELFQELRDELTSAYTEELASVQSLLESGLTTIQNERSHVQLQDQTSIAAKGEAGKIFREELADAMTLILERYARNLVKEIEHLGIRR
ncbi:MAG: hypothetical protein AAGB04_01155 [Pseudomonadota bacterium]